MNEIYRNEEQYYDPTAGEAIRRVMQEGYRERPERPGRTKRQEKTVCAEQPKPEEPGRRIQAASPAEENWEDLANAIILQVVEAYRKARKRLKNHPESKNAKETVRKAERFFLSCWFAQLTALDGEWLLERLRQE